MNRRGETREGEGPLGDPQRIAYVVIAVTSLLIAVGLMFTTADAPLPDFGDQEVLLSSNGLESASALLSQPGVSIDRVDVEALATLAGYYLAIGTSDDGGWQVDFADSGAVAPIAIERAMLGGYESGQPVERITDLAVAGAGTAPAVGVDWSDDQRIAALAAIVEVSGSVDGVLARVPSANSDAVVDLAQSAGIQPRVVGDGAAVVLILDRVSDRSTVASWAYACLDRVPLVGARGCAGPGAALAFVDSPVALPEARVIEDWRVATTGPLDRSESHWLSPEEGGVSWTNGEAQQYRDSAVATTAAGLTLTASPSPEQRVDRAPFDSGMVISEETFGWGRLEVDVRLPMGSGLWPAVWLLDAEACVAPGQCDGYQSTRYHEIDLVETKGDTEVSTSVHWFEQRIRSISSTTDQPVLGDGAVHTFAIDRRPGLLVWSLDGIEIDRVVGSATAAEGPHRAMPMRLVVNLAIGGTFAGDRELGPTSPWWGSSIVPNAYPDLDWTTASIDLASVRFTSLDELVFG